MRNTISIATVSVNTTPMDVNNNVQKIITAYKEAVEQGADIVLTPELAVIGYGLQDMFYVNESMRKIPKVIKKIADSVDENHYLAVGFPLLFEGGQLYNAVALLTHGNVLGIVLKQHLARSGIHYEPRWFTPWKHGSVIEIDFANLKTKVGDLVFDIDGVRLGFEICEDSWVGDRPGRSLCRRLTDIILNPSASHFAIGKQRERVTFVSEGSRSFGVIYVYTNLLGCESGRAVYDGDMMIASAGKMVSMSERLSFAPYKVMIANCDLRSNRQIRMQSSMLLNPQDSVDESVIFTNCCFDEEDFTKPITKPCVIRDEDEHQEVGRVVALGLWDWMRKTYTSGYALSLSGGADSALCAAMVFFSQVQAYATLGEKVYLDTLKQCGISVIPKPFDMEPLTYLKKEVMPKVLLTLYQGSDYSGSVTFNAAKDLAEEIGAWHNSWSISNLVKEYIRLSDSLTPEHQLSWDKDDLALQNIQARVRAPGIWLMANRFNKLLIATSNLSEASVGYCTMDGDTSGVISPIGGISKSRVLKINRYLMENGIHLQDNKVFASDKVQINSMKGIVCQAPTAELRPVEQTDEKDLMPYPLLDEIRSLSQNNNLTPKEVFIELLRSDFVKSMSPQDLLKAVRRYYRLYCRNQWKRERIAVAFHIESDSADPKAFRRFPVLSSALREELLDLDEYAKSIGLQ
ncbi:MAG: NAD(+) synthase [Succinivibrionaceae bacterium]